MSDFRVGDRVDAGWYSSAEKAAWYRGPHGTVVSTAISTSGFVWYRVRWDGGHEAEFPRAELRLARGDGGHFKVGDVRAMQYRALMDPRCRTPETHASVEAA